MIGCLCCGKKTREEQLNPKNDYTRRIDLKLAKAFCSNQCSGSYYNNLQFIKVDWKSRSTKPISYRHKLRKDL